MDAGREVRVDDFVKCMAALTIDRAARIAAIRTTIQSTERLAQVWSQRTTLERYANGAKSLEKTFFRRYSTKFGPITPLFIESAIGGDPTDPYLVANVLVGDWAPILQQQPQTTANLDAWFAAMPPPPAHDVQWKPLTAPITELEVLQAIKSLGKDKATGPNRMPNE